VETTGRSLDERLDSFAEAWKPEPGEKLVGVVVDLDSRETEYGRYAIVTLRTDEGDERAVHAYHTVLAREFEKRTPRLGERLGVKYLGKSDKGYEGYRVAWADIVPPDFGPPAAEDVKAKTATDADFTGGDDEIPF
jgi:hypothetical protein